MGVGFVMEGAYPHVGTIMAAQILWGITYTFTSGATEAWLAGEIGEDALTPTFLRAQQLGQIGALAAIVSAIGLAHIHLWVPIVVGGLLQIALGVWLIFAMPETGFTRVPSERARDVDRAAHDRAEWLRRDQAKPGARAARRRRRSRGCGERALRPAVAGEVPEGGALPVLRRMV